MSGGLPPVEVRGPRLVVRRYNASDAVALHAAILESVDHLTPWMPWAQFEPLEVADREHLIAQWHEKWESGEDFNFGVFDAGRLLGGGGLHKGFGDRVLAIGYWTRATAVRCGVATEAARCLIAAAFSSPTIDFVQIHHDVDNVVSSRIPERLGLSRVVGESAAVESERARVWRLSRTQWESQEQADNSPPDRPG